MSEPTTREGAVDASQLLRLTSDPARIVMGLFVFSNFVYAFATLDEVKHAAPVLIAMMLVNAAAVLLVMDAPDPFPALWTWGVVVAVAASTLLVAFQLPDVGPPGRASWHLGSNTWLLFFLALRRRPGFAWVGYSAMAGGTFLWTFTVGRPAGDAINLLDTHTAILFVATLFEVNLRRTARQINAFDDRSLGSAVEAAEAATASQIRQQRVAELSASAVPLLQRIVDFGPPSTEADRRLYATSEALLRDGVRGKSLVTPRVAEAATSARARGVEVMLLDDRGVGLATGDAMRRMTDAIVARLEGASEGSVTVRLAPARRAVAVSIVTTDGEGAIERLELDDDGRAIKPRPAVEAN